MGAGSDSNNINVLWFDEYINDEENQDYLKELKKTYKNIKEYQ